MSLCRETLLKNTKGTSLMEVVLSVAGIGLVVLLFLQWVNFFSTTTNTVKKNDTIDDAMIRVSEAFNSEDKYCNYILGSFAGNLNPNPNIRISMAFPQGYTVDSVDYHNDVGALGTNVVKRGAIVANDSELSVLDIRLKPIAQIDATNFVSILEFTFQKKNVFGSPQMQRRLPIYATINAGTGFVESCSTSGNSTALLQSRLCEIANDGFAHYDPVTKTCLENTGVVWYQGVSPNEATCPAGKKIALSEFGSQDPLIACRADGDVSTNLPPRSYRSGYVADLDSADGAYVVGADRTTNKCSFVYLASISSVSFKSWVKCY